MAIAPLDLAAAHRYFDRAASTIDDADVVGREIASRMAERLEYIRHEPARIIDAGCRSGRGVELLRRRYPHAEIVAIDAAPAMLEAARSKQTLGARTRAWLGGGKTQFKLAEIDAPAEPDASCGMVWSNLALAWSNDPLATFKSWQRILEIGGLAMFSTYGPDTLKELRAAFGEPGHVHDFIDMHDLGDMLVAAGFADPVMDMEALTLKYASLDALVRDLRATGQRNMRADRPHGLMGRKAWLRMGEAYERLRQADRLPATVEIVYGHAWKPQPKVTADGRTVIRFEPKTSARGDL